MLFPVLPPALLLVHATCCNRAAPAALTVHLRLPALPALQLPYRATLPRQTRFHVPSWAVQVAAVSSDQENVAGRPCMAHSTRPQLPVCGSTTSRSLHIPSRSHIDTSFHSPGGSRIACLLHLFPALPRHAPTGPAILICPQAVPKLPGNPSRSFRSFRSLTPQCPTCNSLPRQPLQTRLRSAAGRPLCIEPLQRERRFKENR